MVSKSEVLLTLYLRRNTPTKEHDKNGSIYSHLD
jgi:hypothetical protein